MPPGSQRDTDPLPLDASDGEARALVGWRAALLTAGAYAAVAWVALRLAGPPGYASPLFPSAGIALAAVLVWGRAALPGVWLGSLAANAGLGALRGHAGLELLALPAVIAAGAALQAGVGAALVRRFAGTPVVLTSPRAIALAGLFGALLSCTISPSVATPALLASGTLDPSSWASSWLTWWVGDTLGVLIAGPAMLTLIGRPAADWRARRLTVGLPMLLALGLLTLAMLEVARLDAQRQRAAFERDADRLAAEAQSRLQVPLFALQALAGLARTHTALDPSTLREASRWWLGQPGQLQAVGWSVRVPQPALAAFEAAARADGLPGYRVFQRDGGAALAADGEVVAIRLIEPAAGNAAALGVNALSIPEARSAILATQRSAEPAATGGFRLTQSTSDETGIVVYQALYEGQPADAAARTARFRGVVFVTVRVEAMLKSLDAPALSHLGWCLVDPQPDAPRRRIAGPAGCDAAADDGRVALLRSSRPVQVAGRAFELRVSALPDTLPRLPVLSRWLLSAAAMSAAAMLGALLLVVTGHSRRTELAVQTGTAVLRREMDERAQAEQALRDSEARLRDILDHLPIGVMFLDADGQLLACNPRLCEMLGRSAEQLRGRVFDERVLAGEAWERGAAGARPASGVALPVGRRRMRLARAEGQALWVQVSTSALRSADPAAPGRWVGVVEDITEHLRLEASERALQQAEASSRAKSEFVSRMSHELRTPLNAMLGFAQLMALDREPALVDHQREWVQQVQRAGWHLLEMINETLDLARIESGAVSLALEPVAVAPLLAATTALVAASAAEHGLSLQHSAADDMPPVLADATRLKQVLTNLLSNAVKYNRQGGAVVVDAARAPDGMVEISVSDSGLGMTPEQVGALFQPYNRLGREASHIEGTGIGLVISRRLAELMGGSLRVRSAAGQGSTFTLRLPATTGPGAPERGDPVTAPAPYRQRSVHYVEDNATNVEVMRGVLLQRPQVTLTVSTNGLDGLEAIRREQPDLVLLDMHLPDVSGLELLRHLKHDEALAGIPVMVVSADATTARIQEALTLGAVHYVTKPLDLARFLVLLDEVLEGLDTHWGM